MMNNKDLIRRLTKQGRATDREGYGGDAVEKYFRANVLFYCEQLLDKFKGIERQMKYLCQTLEELKDDNKG